MGWKTRIARKKCIAVIKLVLFFAFVADVNALIEYLKIEHRIVIVNHSLARSIETPEAKEEPVKEAAKEQSVEEQIVAVFHEEPELALAVFKAESVHNPKAIGYNCRYGNISQACRPEDRHKAWSVDCGVAQINIQGQTCPEELLEVGKNLAIAKSMYEKRGWSPWWAYRNGAYKKHL